MTFLLCDFSNSARKAYTQVKKATLLGGMGKPSKKLFNSEDLKEVLKTNPYKQVAKRIVSDPDYGRWFDAPFIKKTLDDAVISKAELKRLKAKQYDEPKSYVDAIQTARRGSVTPIKADTYIDRSYYIRHPQDNTVLAGTLKKIDKLTKESGGYEHGTVLYKDKKRLRAAPIVDGSKDGVIPQLFLPPGKKQLINIHSHPKGSSNEPSLADLDPSTVAAKTKLIVAKNKKGDKTIITRYNSTRKSIPEENDTPNLTRTQYRDMVKKEGGSYKYITPRTKQ